MLTRVRLKYQAGDGPVTEPQEEGEGHGEEEEGHGHTHFEGAIDEGELMKNYSSGLKWRPMGMNVDWKRTP
jgi:hypothetical protein